MTSKRLACKKDWIKPHDYLQVDHWPFILCYFDQKRKPPTVKENLISSLKIFSDCVSKTKEGGYYMGFKAYEVWASDLRNHGYFETCDDEQIARRLSVNQFCILSLLDARKAAYNYLLNSNAILEDELLSKIIGCFERIVSIAADIHHILDSKVALNGIEARQFWTAEKRCRQADALDEMAGLERQAHAYAESLIAQQDLNS